MARVKAVFYAINGTGCGHISRQLNIAREMRELLHALGLGADFHVLTTSEAPQQGWDFPTYKLPSKTVVAEVDTPNEEFASYSTFLNTTLVATFRPDILVLDTMPQGSFGEFQGMRTFARSTAFIRRHTNPVAADHPVYRSHMGLYDLILTPDDPEEAYRYTTPEEVRHRCVFTGIVHGYRSEEAWSREAVRTHFGVQPHQTLMYISAGGGGDKRAETDLTRLIDAASADPSHFVLVGYGPLYRGRKRYASNIVPLTDPDVRQYFGGLDLAISAAGYNTYEELLAAGVPTAFFGQVKGMDCQDERVQIGVKNGWNRELCEFDPVSIQEEINALKRSDIQQAIRSRLQERGTSDGALVSAVELLKLHASLKGSSVDISKVYVAAVMRRLWPAIALRIGVVPEQSRAAYVSVVRLALAWNKALRTQREQQSLLEDALVAWRTGVIPEYVALLLEMGHRLAELQAELQLNESKFIPLFKRFDEIPVSSSTALSSYIDKLRQSHQEAMLPSIAA